ncbi:hypothetical protein RND81_04G090200 [Saponaria officinalis]|uniref:Uncharacterized protein n=1 Tax=Saponaria officinalis TaxID=3572 RepID=A0AAW1LK32_SAPOF
MLIALSAKNKLGFVDGTIAKPASTSSTAKAWQMSNDVVFSWILNAVSEDIANSILYSDSAKQAWNELEEWFGQSNVEFTQGNDTISSYFTKIKVIWDVIDSMGLNPNCSCTCTCGASEKRVKFQQDQRIVQLLMGLNDLYSVIRGTILLQNPLPSLSTVYNNLVQEERHGEIHNETPFPSNSASFYAKNHKFTRGGASGTTQPFRDKGFVSDAKRPVSCNYCKKPGHTIDRCYKLQYNRNKKLANVAHINFHDELLGGFGAQQGNAVSSEDIDPTIYHQLMHVLRNAGQPTVTNAAQSVPSSSNFAGITTQLPVVYACNSSWILYTGASDHMCFNKDLFSDIRTISKLYVISLPNGQFITINYVGTVPITSEISLQNVLFVPSFKYNLLSIFKLAKQFDSIISFTPNFCFMQGSSTKKPLILGNTTKDLLPSKILLNKSPYELIFNTSPDLTHLRVFGCLCYASTPKPGRTKISPRAIPSVFLGYPFGKKAYKLLNLDTFTIFTSRDVVFHENIFPYIKDSYAHYLPIPIPDTTTISPAPASVIPLRQCTRPSHPSSYLRDYLCNLKSLSSSSCTHTVTCLCISTPQTGLPICCNIGTDPLLDTKLLIPTQEPMSYKQATAFPEWQTAIAAEFSALEANETRKLVPLPNGEKVIKCK